MAPCVGNIVRNQACFLMKRNAFVWKRRSIELDSFRLKIHNACEHRVETKTTSSQQMRMQRDECP